MSRYQKRALYFGLAVGVFGLLGCARDPGTQPGRAVAYSGSQQTAEAEFPRAEANATSHDDTTQVARDWGVEVLGIHLSAAGYMLDFRYRVIDPEKAALIASDQVKPYVIDQATGAKMYVPNPPKVGPLRQKSQKLEPGRVYFVLFANPGRFVKAGNKVTIAFGDAEFKDLVVNDPTPPKASTALHVVELASRP